MNIAIDISGVLAPPIKNRGIGVYCIDHIKELLKKDTENKYFLLNFYEDIDLKSLFNYGENVTSHYFNTGENNVLLYDLKYKNIIDNILENFIKDYEIDIFWLTYTFNPLICYDINTFKEVQLIVTAYDIIPYLFQKEYLSNRDVRKWFMSCIEFLEKSDYVLSISQSVKDDLISYLGMNKNKIFNIYAGISNKFRKIEVSEELKFDLYKKYKIDSEYIMCTGGEDFRKNIDGLISAYAILPKELIEKYQLIIVCKLSNNALEKYKNLAIRKNVADRVLFTNFVSDEELVIFYNLASLMAFPSKYEGFGLPVIEAMACGTPVLTSENSSLGEIAKEAAFLVDPFNLESISNGLKRALTCQNIEDYIVNGYKTVGKYTWEDTAKLTIKAFNSVDTNKNDKNELKKLAFFIPNKSKSIEFVNYVNERILYFTNKYNMCIFTQNIYETKKSGFENLELHDYKEFDKKQFDELIYFTEGCHMDSNILSYFKKNGGILDIYSISSERIISMDYLKEFYDYINAEFRYRFIVHNDNMKLSILSEDIYHEVFSINSNYEEDSELINGRYERILNANHKPIGRKILDDIVMSLNMKYTLGFNDLIEISKTIEYAKKIVF